MTLQEVCAKYGMSESSMKSMFARSQASILKKYGVKIIREGRGKDTTYREEFMDDKRAATLYSETKEKIIIDEESFKLMNWDFMVFLAIVTTPMLVFRGSYQDFLKYVEAPLTEASMRMLKDALIGLKNRDFISYTIDKTDSNYFIAAIYHKVEEEMCIGVGMIKTCKRLAEKYHKRSWVPLLKTWLGVQMLSENQPYTVDTLCAITGLSAYQIRTSNKILTDSFVYKTSRAYAAYQKCLGTNVDLNVEAFYKLD